MRLRTWLLTILMLGPSLALAAVGIGTPCPGAGADGVDNYSFSCTASGTNLAVVLDLNLNDNSQTINTLTYGGDAFTLIMSRDFTPPSYKTAKYQRVNPATGAQTVSIVLSGISDIKIGVTPYTGVDQTTPFGTAVGSHSAGVTSRSDGVTSAAGELVTDALFTCDDTGLAIGAAQTQQWMAFSGHSLRSSTKAGAAGTVTTSWTWTNADCGMHIAVPIKPAASVAAPRRANPMVFQ